MVHLRVRLRITLTARQTARTAHFTLAGVVLANAADSSIALLLFSLFPGNQFALRIVWYKIVIPWQHQDYRTITALSLGIETVINDNPSKPWYNYYTYCGFPLNTTYRRSLRLLTNYADQFHRCTMTIYRKLGSTSTNRIQVPVIYYMYPRTPSLRNHGI